MNAKKVIGFLLMRPAFTQRNVTSIVLVAVFFGVYAMMGGKVTTELPKVNKNGSFGSAQPAKKLPLPGSNAGSQPSGGADAEPADTTADATADAQAKGKRKSSLQLLGLKPSEDREARRRALLGRTLFDKEEREELENQPLDKDGLVEGVVDKNIYLERRLERVEKRRDSDSLSAIEQRLKIQRD